MPALHIILDGDGAWPDLLEKKEQGLLAESERVSVSCLASGMASGKPSVSIRIDLDDGMVVLAQTSLSLFLSAADAMRARYGDPRR